MEESGKTSGSKEETAENTGEEKIKETSDSTESGEK